MEALLFHPRMIHVPMALGVLMPFIAGGLLLAWWRNWLTRRAWVIALALQTILVGSGVLAISSGEAEERRVERVVAESFINTHEGAAQLFVWASGGVLAMMILADLFGSRRARRRLAALATIGTVGVLGLGYRTGQTGGSLVYKHGAAQAYIGTATPAAMPQAAARNGKVQTGIRQMTDHRGKAQKRAGLVTSAASRVASASLPILQKSKRPRGSGQGSQS